MQLTIVLPTYNEAENLPKLIPALFAQPLPELKLLIVDDGSPDGTGRIAEELGEKYPSRIRVHHRSGETGLGHCLYRWLQISFGGRCRSSRPNGQ